VTPTPRPTLTPSKLRVLIALLDSAHFDGRVASLKSIAARLGWSHSYLYDQVMVKLAGLGLVELDPEKCGTIRLKCRVEFFPESGLKPAPSPKETA
jgi:DNA-binding IscR family transcriptional regulator